MPCESWSRARKWDGGPPPLRDNDSFLYGYDYLTGSNRIRVEQGNALLKATFLLALAAIAAGTPWTIENHFSSRAWLTFEMTKLQELGALPQQVHLLSIWQAVEEGHHFLRVENSQPAFKTVRRFLWAMLCFWSKTSRVRRPKIPKGSFALFWRNPTPRTWLPTLLLFCSNICKTCNHFLPFSQNTPKSGVGRQIDGG